MCQIYIDITVRENNLRSHQSKKQVKHLSLGPMTKCPFLWLVHKMNFFSRELHFVFFYLQHFSLNFINILLKQQLIYLILLKKPHSYNCFPWRLKSLPVFIFLKYPIMSIKKFKWMKSSYNVYKHQEMYFSPL